MLGEGGVWGAAEFNQTTPHNVLGNKNHGQILSERDQFSDTAQVHSTVCRSVSIACIGFFFFFVCFFVFFVCSLSVQV